MQPLTSVTRLQSTLLAVLAALTAASCIKAPFPSQMYLQHLPTAAAIVALGTLPRRYKISDAAFACLVAFLALHVLGARYIYSYVPYDDWSRALFGFSLSARFHWQRNHFDRVVHFFFGLLWVYPVWEIFRRHFRVPDKFARYVAIEFVMAFSMLYELFEWGLAMVLSPQDAGAYNGQQGDIWDAQKDMSFAVAGALLATVAIVVGRRIRKREGL
jgi:putative membrane protein